MNPPKVVRWLRSRPLARVRRNLATERRIRARLKWEGAVLTPEINALFDRELRRLARLDKVER
jgi:hypothetical protein